MSLVALAVVLATQGKGEENWMWTDGDIESRIAFI